MLTKFLPLSLKRLVLGIVNDSSELPSEISQRKVLTWIAFILILAIATLTLTACTVSQQPPDVCSGKYCPTDSPTQDSALGK